MKSLIERMTVEHVNDLKRAELLYPISVGNLFKELETKKFYSDLTYDVVGTLVSHLGLRSYDPGTISSVFKFD